MSDHAPTKSTKAGPTSAMEKEQDSWSSPFSLLSYHRDVSVPQSVSLFLLKEILILFMALFFYKTYLKWLNYSI